MMVGLRWEGKPTLRVSAHATILFSSSDSMLKKKCLNFVKTQIGDSRKKIYVLTCTKQNKYFMMLKKFMLKYLSL